MKEFYEFFFPKGEEEFLKVKSINQRVVNHALKQIMSKPLAYSGTKICYLFIQFILAYIFDLTCDGVKDSISLLILSHMFDKDLIKNNKFLNDNDKQLLIEGIDLFLFLYYLEFKEEIKDYKHIFSSKFARLYQNILSGETVDSHKENENFTKGSTEKKTQLDFLKFIDFEEVKVEIEKDYLERQEKICSDNIEPQEKKCLFQTVLNGREKKMKCD